MFDKKWLLRTIGLLVVICIVLVFTLPLYFVDDWAGGTLVWNSQEAYLFLTWTGLGYHSTAFGSLLSLAVGYFGASRGPDETRQSTIVFRITPTKVERFDIPDVVFRAYIPLDKTIYAWDGSSLSKWAGTGFERVNTTEEGYIVAGHNLTSLSNGIDVYNPTGWSVRNSLAGWPTTLEIELERKKTYFFMSLGDLNREMSLDVQLSNGTREPLLRAKSKLHFISASEYKSKFRKGQAH